MIRSYLNCIYYLIAMKNNNIIKILKSLKTYLMNLIYRILHFTKVSQSKEHTVLKSTLNKCFLHRLLIVFSFLIYTMKYKYFLRKTTNRKIKNIRRI